MILNKDNFKLIDPTIGVYRDTSITGTCLIKDPTGNCQLSMMHKAETFINKSYYDPNTGSTYINEDLSKRDFEENMLNFFRNPTIGGMRAMLLFDVTLATYNRLVKLFDPKEIVLCSKYTSTRASEMVLVIVRTNRFREKVQEEIKQKLSAAVTTAF